jgi:hypothetical protein
MIGLTLSKRIRAPWLLLRRLSGCSPSLVKGGFGRTQVLPPLETVIEAEPLEEDE